jgi:thiosulfate/3-mercaptopyruvate sulfurtransferase
VTVPALLLAAMVAAAAPDSMLVSPQWLAAHRTDPALVILHVSMDRAGYERGHVPGARWLDPHGLMSMEAPGVELPPVERIDSVLESLGISDQSRVVYYGDTWMAPRVFLALEYAGLGDRAALLDGGLAAWRASGGTVTGEVPTWTRGRVTTRAHPEILVSADWLQKHLDDAVLALVDVRSRGEYAATDSSERLPRFGHIPGGVNLPWEQTFTDPAAALEGRPSPLRPVAELRRLFATSGVRESSQLVTYCTVGLRASHMYFVARYLGWRPRIYDGSMSEWSRNPALPIVRGTAPR